MSSRAIARWPSFVAVALLVVALTGGALAAGIRPEPSASSWPVSSDLLVSEVVTGGASASDEFVEIYNGGPVARDLAGLELVYVTSTGSTLTRKASWETPTPLGPGRHLLLANAAGIFGPLADAPYSGGLSAAGGVLVLRRSGGTPLDSLAWGDASNAFVEGSTAPAPRPGWSVERRPGGTGGNGVDSNDSLADTLLQPSPEPQGLAAPPVPPQPTTAAPPPASGMDAPGPTTTSSSAPPDASLPGTDAPPPATPDAPPEPATPSTGPSPVPVEVAAARGLPPGAPAIVEGTLTSPLGLVEGGRGAFLQDPTGGIAIHLASGEWPPLGLGAAVRVRGIVDSRYGQLTLRLEEGRDLVPVPVGASIEPLPAGTGEAGEHLESRLVTVAGSVTSGPDVLSDGFASDLDDGTGPLRVVAPAASGVTVEDLPRGARVRLIGVLGQRDSSGTGSGGYRLYLRDPGDVAALPAAPTLTPSPGVTAPSSASPFVSASPGTTTAPTAAPSSPPPAEELSIAAARTHPVGASVAVRGVVTVEPGRVVDERTFFIQQGTAGIAVRLASSADATVRRGGLLVVSGRLAERYGNLEIRAEAGDVTTLGRGPVPGPVGIATRDLGERLEGRLVRLAGRIEGVQRGSSGSVSITVEDVTGRGRVFLHGALGVDPRSLPRGSQLVAVGIAGQRASARGRADGYRVWPRDRGDLRIVAPSSPQPGPGGTAGGPRGQAERPVSIRAALGREGERVVVTGVVTSPPGLLDADARRVTLQDATAAILVRLPAAASKPRPGDRLRVEGVVGSYYRAPQLEADQPPRRLGRGDEPAARRVLRAPFDRGLEWRLVRVSGRVTDRRRNGASWRAELAVTGGGSIPVHGLSRSGIRADALEEGARATITGIVRRPLSSASDRRLGLVPRRPADLVVVSAAASKRSGASTGRSGAGATRPGGRDLRGGRRGAMSAEGGAVVADVPLGELRRHDGRHVRVGGAVVGAKGLEVTLRDRSGRALVRLPRSAGSLVRVLRRGEIVNATGVARLGPRGPIVEVRRPSDLARVGALSPRRGGSQGPAKAVPSGAPAPGAPAEPSPVRLVAAALLALAASAVALGVAQRRNRRRTGTVERQ